MTRHLGHRLYAALIRCYPREIREQHARELLAIGEDLRAGWSGRATRLWIRVLVDLGRGVIRERLRVVLTPRRATVVSVAVAAPFLLALTSMTLGWEPPIAAALQAPNGSPTPVARVIMLGLLASLPLALVINAWPRFVGSRARPRFAPPARHVLLGLAVLCAPLALMGGQLSRELAPLLKPLGVSAVMGEAACLLLLASLPVAVLANRVPVLGLARVGSASQLRAVSANLVVAAGLIMTIVLLAGIFAAEGLACTTGVPNCD